MMDKTIIKNHIIKETTKLFLTQGYTKTTTKQIASICNISEGALFRTFKDKETILFEIVKEVIDNNLFDIKSFDEYFSFLTSNMYQSNKNKIINDLLIQVYSLKKISNYINEKVAILLNKTLGSKNIKEYYELEVAHTGIFLSYLNLDTNIYLDIDYKINRYIEILSYLYSNINKNNIYYTKELNYEIIIEYFSRKGGNN